MNGPQHDHVMIVEDEPRIAAVLGDYLANAGYTHHWVADGAKVVPAFHAEQPDLVLLDLMLPSRDGIDLFHELRQFSQVPVIIVTAKVEEIDRLLGMEIGADDYICKPFSPREVVARVAAVLRRHRHVPTFAMGDQLTLDLTACRASVNGRSLNLTAVEFRLLSLLHGAQGRLFSRNDLLERLYDDRRVVTDRTVDSHVKNLRRKMVEAGGNEEWIKSIYGAGYRMELK